MKKDSVALVLCLFLGIFGAHKFYQGKIGLGILYIFTLGLLGIGWFVDIIVLLIRILDKPSSKTEVPQVSSLLPEGVINEIWAGQLPVYADPPELMLSAGEKCHFIDNVSLLNERSRTWYEGGTAGVSVRIAKGFTVRTSSSRGVPIKEFYTEETPGRLFITTKRLIFLSFRQNIERQWSRLTSIRTYTDAVALQFGNTNYIFVMPHPLIADRLIRTLRIE